MQSQILWFDSHDALTRAILAAGFVHEPSFGYVLRIFGMEWSTTTHHNVDGRVGLTLWKVGA